MTLLTPLGLLGLLGIVALIIIYIIKPNYQQKMVSSTFVWKLSLKYRKKRLPVSKLRNVLLIVCQILILTLCAIILTQPNQVLKTMTDTPEAILIIDASASMRTTSEQEKRFERAVYGALERAETTFSENGIVSVILADGDSEFLAQRAETDRKEAIRETLSLLVEQDACTFGEADVTGAWALCEDVIAENANAKIYFYTDTTYEYVPDGVTVVNVCEEGEWNAAILDAYAELYENYYAFYVDVACYGRDESLTLELEVHNANAESGSDGKTVSFSTTVFCDREKIKRVVFINADLYEERANESEDVIYYLIEKEDEVFSYRSVHVSINEADSFSDDNAFEIYGGQKEVLKVQYTSADPNPFMSAVLYTMRNAYAKRWDIKITEVKKGNTPATEGFDFYIFEHSVPSELPKDGVVFFINPEQPLPAGTGVRADNVVDLRREVYLVEENEEHPLLKYVNAENIYTQKFVQMTYDPSYEVLLSVAGSPALIVTKEENTQIAVLSFGPHFSNLVMEKDFTLLVYNMFGYFFPAMVNGNAFEVYENVEVNARGSEISLSYNGSAETQILTEFPSSVRLDMPGTYVLSQTTFFGKEVSENIYVKIPGTESNIWKTEEALEDLYKEQDEADYYKDLLLFVAAALVAILFAEWFLHNRENA